LAQTSRSHAPASSSERTRAFREDALIVDQFGGGGARNVRPRRRLPSSTPRGGDHGDGGGPLLEKRFRMRRITGVQCGAAGAGGTAALIGRRGPPGGAKAGGVDDCGGSSQRPCQRKSWSKTVRWSQAATKPPVASAMPRRTSPMRLWKRRSLSAARLIR